MYLTRFRVNTQRVTARRLLSSPQMLHAAVLSSFAEPPKPATGGPRVLWRLDRNSTAETYLYIVSPDQPDLTHLVEQAGWPTTGRWQALEYAPFLSRLSKGDQWAFRLTANPVHSIRRTDGEPTKVTAHITPRHQMRWLLDRQEKAGFTIVEKPRERRLMDGDVHELIIHNCCQLAFRKNGNAHPVSLATATFDGKLEVTDPDAFRRTLTCGLGRAKAYGCGLMTLAVA